MFRAPIWLAAALLGPAAVLLFKALADARRAKVAKLLGRPGTLARLVPAETGERRAWRAGLRAAAAALLALALAGPQWGVELVPAATNARSVVIAVDVSASMAAEDVSPNRLERAKEQLSLLIDGLKGDRVGIVAFAGQAALVCPVTADLDAAKQILRALEPGLVATPGTAIGQAVRLGTEALSRYAGGKALVVISDGEDHETDPLGAADEAAAQNVRVFGIGVGTPEGGPIPVKDASGGLSGYKKDRSGSTVVTRLGERTLADVAQRASGAYYRATPSGDEAVAVAEQIKKLDASRGGASGAARYQSRYLLPLWAAFVFLLAEALVLERRSGGKAALAVFLFLLAGPARAGEGDLRRANRAYDAGKYEEALERYGAAARKAPRDPRPVFNAGDALHRLDRNDQAADAFGAVAGSNVPPAIKAAAHYNRGNALFSDGKYAEAVGAYRKAVTLDPSDEDARRNLAVALHFLKNPKSNSKSKDDKKDEKQDPKSGGGGGGAKDQPKDQQEPPKAGDTRSRPQDRMSREDAERVMRAVGENEKQRAPQIQLGKEPPKPADVEKDW